MTLPPPKIRFHDDNLWSNFHGNIRAPIEGVFEILNEAADGQAVPTSEKWKLGLHGLQQIVQKAEAEGKQLRATGSGWSLSDATICEDWLLETRSLNRLMQVGFPKQFVHPNYSKPRSRLVLAQSGMLISTLNAVLAKKRLSLPTCGASNGQTLAGSISTGTHGSAFNFGSLQDAVVGIHVVGADGKPFWLERSSNRVTTPEFTKQLNAKAIRNNNVFNAALVSFGSFGLIHAYLLETEPLFTLQSFRWKQALNSRLWRLISTLDFSLMDSPITLPRGKPYSFEVAIDPFHAGNAAYVTVTYKRKAPANYIPDFHGPDSVLGSDALDFVATLLSAVPPLAPFILGKVLDSNLAPVNTPGGKIKTPRSLGETFSGTSANGNTSSAEIGIDLEDVRRTLDLILDVFGQEQSQNRPFLGPIALRFVKSSDALLAFTRFPITCTIELPSARTAYTRTVLEHLWEALEAADIPFTFHWGQENNLNAKRVRKMYGKNRVDKWIKARKKILSTPKSRRVFSNDLLRRCKLG